MAVGNMVALGFNSKPHSKFQSCGCIDTVQLRCTVAHAARRQPIFRPFCSQVSASGSSQSAKSHVAPRPQLLKTSATLVTRPQGVDFGAVDSTTHTLETAGSSGGVDSAQWEQQGASTLGQPASMSRVLLSVQPVRAATVSPRGGRSIRPGGSSSIWLVIFSIGAAVLATAHAKMRTVRECSSCRGYGVQRCKLCQGKGGIEWEGKMAHREPCPMCLGRRFVSCACCGGGGPFSRTLFSHKNKRGEALLQQLQEFGGITKQQQPRRWLFGRMSTTSSQEDMNEESDRFAEEIMMD